jgi:Pyridoxamine 5'-phosphate oxidase
MTSGQDLGAIARAIVDANVYMTIGTAGEDGDPWVSPVFFAHSGYRELYWISSPEAAHSRNLARRPRVSIVVFDSKVAPGTGQAVYMSATAARLDGAGLDRALGSYPGFTERGGRAVSAEDLRPPAPYRLYRATVSAHWILCPRSSGPCALHGRAFDHRTAVTL